MKKLLHNYCINLINGLCTTNGVEEINRRYFSTVFKYPGVPSFCCSNKIDHFHFNCTFVFIITMYCYHLDSFFVNNQLYKN